MNEEQIPFKRFQIRWRERVGTNDCIYLIRYTITMFGHSLRLHHWLFDDDQRYKHDHGSDMYILILKGGYTDISDAGDDHVTAGSFRHRPAEWRHTVRLDPDGCWSLLYTPPQRRHWGFWLPGRIRVMRPLRYFSRYGHHQCD